MVSLVNGATENAYNVICIGDEKSPENYKVTGCRYYSIKKQLDLGYKYAGLCRNNHYARKNIGYLIAIQKRASMVIDTDDDNTPLPSFWSDKSMKLQGDVSDSGRWVNIYSYFSEESIWPRGFPLQYLGEEINRELKKATCLCPIQQGLVNGDPDVDAIFRLTRNSTILFSNRDPIILGPDSWCPFNSQNTTWWPPAFPLLYLPSTCSFRMTDIWRSFIAQYCLRPNRWHVGFVKPTMLQVRNSHNLMVDFEDEIPGYLYNDEIVSTLLTVSLKVGNEHTLANMYNCYESLVNKGWLLKSEMKFVEAWCEDVSPYLMSMLQQ
jgi:hypothetical protein